jgi:hypothetical protein
MFYYRLQLTGGGSETYTSCVGYSVFMLMLSSDGVPAAATAASCCLSMSVVSPAFVIYDDDIDLSDLSNIAPSEDDYTTRT